jgi:glycolate oxidase FAD binding subunit
MVTARERNEAVSFAGGGTELELGYPPERVDTVITTDRLGSVVDYAPDDMTVTVEAGVTPAQLQGLLAQHRQRLALDAPLPERATIGGLVATNGFGPRRMRFGALRDLILGASLVRADGVRVRSGGKVVKNVAGFDVPKLLVGSLGTLGCIATATFRLHPLPEAQTYVRVHCRTPLDVRALCADIVETQLEPSAVVALSVEDGCDVEVLFEGFSAVIERQAASCTERARARGLSANVVEPDGSTAFWAMHESARVAGDVRAKVTFPPALLADVYDAALGRHARTFGDCAVALYPTLGIAFCSGSGGDAAMMASALSAARTVAEKAGGSLVVLAAPPEVRERVDIYGTLPPSFELMRRIKERFDPGRRCNRGRFVGHL